MDDQKHPQTNGTSVNKPRKKKSTIQDPETYHSLGDSLKRLNEMRPTPDQKGQKVSKRAAMNESSPSFPDRLNPKSLPDTSTSANDYRALRRKYLLLEEESFGLGRELKTVEDDIKALEEEKLSLLDELVVLEGLVEPSDLQSQGQRLQLQCMLTCKTGAIVFLCMVVFVLCWYCGRRQKAEGLHIRSGSSDADSQREQSNPGFNGGQLSCTILNLDQAKAPTLH